MFALKNPTFAPGHVMRPVGVVTPDRVYLRFSTDEQGMTRTEVGLYVASSTKVYATVPGADDSTPLTRGDEAHPELTAPVQGFTPAPERNTCIPNGQTLTFDREEIETGKYGPFKTQTFDRLLSGLGFRLTDKQTRTLEEALKDALAWVDKHAA